MRGLLPVFLCLPLLAGFAPEGLAQAPVANADGSYTVTKDWPLKPAGVGGGDQFRLLFVTSNRHSVPTSTDIATYNTIVQNRANAGHMAVRTVSSAFRVVGSTATVDARDNTSTTGTGMPIYWLNGAKVADDYADFYDNSWDSHAVRNERGARVTFAEDAWTGSNPNGTKHTDPLGGNSLGQVRVGAATSGFSPLSNASTTLGMWRLYGLSPVFTVESSLEDDPVPIDPPVLMLEIMGSRVVNEGESVAFRVNADNGASEDIRFETSKFVKYLMYENYRYKQVDTFEYNLIVSPALITIPAGATQSDVFSISVQEDSKNVANGYIRVEIPSGCRVGDCTRYGKDSNAVWYYYRGLPNEVILAIRDNEPGQPPGSDSPTITPDVQVPDTPVSNVRVTPIDDQSVSVAWDTVPHATGYDVEWDILAGDPPESTGGGAMKVTGGSATVNHFAEESATLSLTVTPEYVDGNGDTQLLNDLAGTATLEVGPTGVDSGTGQPEDQATDDPAAESPMKDYSGLIAKVRGYAGEDHGEAHQTRWKRVLAAFGEDNGHRPMTAAEARQMAATYSRGRWAPVVAALTELEADGDGTPAPAETCVPDTLRETVTGYSEEGYGEAHVARWMRVLAAFGDDSAHDEAMTSAEAWDMADSHMRSRWEPVAEAIECLERRRAEASVHVPLVPSASNPSLEGVVSIVNPAGQSGGVRVVAIDDAGQRLEPVVFGIGSGESVEIGSRDIERGGGPGAGDWRLEVSSGPEVEVHSHVRSFDGLVSAMGEVVPSAENAHHVPLFHPAGEVGAASLLRLTNRGEVPLEARIDGIDDAGAVPGSGVRLALAAGSSVLLTAEDLEGGSAGLEGALGDGHGNWRLSIASDGDLAVMNLLESAAGHLSNLSNATSVASGEASALGAHAVTLLPPASDMLGRRGLVRIVNGSQADGQVRIRPVDGAGRRYEPLMLALGAGEAANIDALDIELGDVSGGLAGSTGPGTGDWRLEISSELDIKVVSYVLRSEGVLEAVSDRADSDRR